jgi:PKD repeat protein
MKQIHIQLLPVILAISVLTLSSLVGGGPLAGHHGRGSSDSPALSYSASTVHMGGEASPSFQGVSPDNTSRASWTYVTQASLLQDPFDATMTYDAADGYVLWYGGDCGGFGCNQTAAFQNGTWRIIRTPVSPTAQMDAPIAYDAADGYVVLQGGTGYNCYAYTGEYTCNETWEYKSGVWTQLQPRCYYLGLGYGNCSLPAGYHPMVYDAATGSVFLDGGSQGGPSGVSSNGDYGPWVYKNDTWTYLGYNFSSGLTISNPKSQSLVYDAADGYVMAFGGAAPSPSLPGNLGDNYTWVWNNNNWTNISANVSNAPPPRITTSMVYDATDGYVLLYGGDSTLCTANVSSDCYYAPEAVPTAYADTWKYVGGNWTELNSSSAPGYAPEPLLAYDPIDRGVVDYNDFSCGSTNFSAGCTSCPCTSEATWLWGPAAPVGNVSITARNAVDVGVSMSLSVTFDGGTAPFTIEWAFGDGQFANGRSVAHTYSRAGNFTAVVWVNDSQGYHAVASTSVAVYAQSQATAYAYPNPTDVGLGASFFPGILNGRPPQYSFNWSFGDGETASYVCLNPCGPSQDRTFHSYSAPGVFDVQVLITYSDGAIVNESFPIQVNSNPAVNGLYATPNPAVLGQPVNFTTLVMGGTAPFTYSWEFGDGGTGGNLSEITHIYTTNGPFEASVQVTDAAGFATSASLSVTITLTAGVTGNTSLGAAPLAVSFESSVQGGVPGYAYFWQFGDGSTSSSPDPIHVYTQPGDYTATLEVKDSVGHTDTVNWPVQTFPGGANLDLAIRASATNISVGETTILTLSPSGGVGDYTVRWLSTPQDCVPVSTLSMRCTPAENGTYSASAEVTDSRGTTATASVTFFAGTASVTSPGGGGKGILGLDGSDGLYLVLGLVGGALVGIGSTVVITRRRGPRDQTQATPTGTPSSSNEEFYTQAEEAEDSADHLRDLF